MSQGTSRNTFGVRLVVAILVLGLLSLIVSPKLAESPQTKIPKITLFPSSGTGAVVVSGEGFGVLRSLAVYWDGVRVAFVGY